MKVKKPHLLNIFRNGGVDLNGDLMLNNVMHLKSKFLISSLFLFPLVYSQKVLSESWSCSIGSDAVIFIRKDETFLLNSTAGSTTPFKIIAEESKFIHLHAVGTGFNYGAIILNKENNRVAMVNLNTDQEDSSRQIIMRGKCVISRE